MLHRSSFNSRGGTEEGAQFGDKCWQRRSSAVRSAIARRVDRIEDRSEFRIAQLRAHFAQHKRLQSDRPVRPLGSRRAHAQSMAQCSTEVRVVGVFCGGTILLPGDSSRHNQAHCADAAPAGKRLCMRSLLHLVDPNHLIAVGGHSVAQTTVEPRVPSLRSWALPRCARRGWPTTPKTFPPFRSDTTNRRAVRKGTVGSAASLSRRVGMVTGAHC